MLDHPVVAATRRVAAEVLEPAAADVDANGVPRSHLRALAAAGVFGVSAPTDGRAEPDSSVVREVSELIAGADAATWFVQVQHHGPVRILAMDPDRPVAVRYLAPLAAGELVAGFAFSHLRRFPERPVVATRVPGGWRFDGVAPWYTGWGLNDLAFMSGVTDDGQVVLAVVPAVEGAGLTMKSRIRTAALDAAHTVVLSLDGVTVSDDDVALHQPHADWIAGDVANANANPAIFGIGMSAVDLLRRTGDERTEAATVEAAAVYGARLADVRRRCYALADEAPPAEAIDERLALRAEALEVLIAITSALVAAGAGPAMSVRSPAQRKAREALFMLVQAQTAPARSATLRRWVSSVTAPGAGRA